MRAICTWRATTRAAVAPALAAALAIAGCGAGERAERPSGPASITISATISPRAVSVSPSHLAARTVDLLISNQTSKPRRLALRSVRLAGGGDALTRTTGPIDPGATISLHAELGEGDYVASIRGSSIAPAAITVGPASATTPDDLLAP